MTPKAIIREAAEDGVRLALTPAGTIKAIGEQVAVNRWLPAIREHKAEILVALQEAVNDPISWGWRVAFPDGRAFDCYIVPEQTRADVRKMYPSATVEPIREVE
jgi:hypothetical protein